MIDDNGNMTLQLSLESTYMQPRILLGISTRSSGYPSISPSILMGGNI